MIRIEDNYRIFFLHPKYHTSLSRFKLSSSTEGKAVGGIEGGAMGRGGQSISKWGGGEILNVVVSNVTRPETKKIS